MAKKPAKTSVKTAAKKAVTTKAPSVGSIEKISVQALTTLQSLGIEQQLQSDIEWCLGSYRHDQNPAGLYDMMERALSVLQDAKARKAKGVTTKLIGDLEKSLQAK
jgi:hypothetical protein